MDRSLEQYDINISTRERSAFSKELDAKVKSNFHHRIDYSTAVDKLLRLFDPKLARLDYKNEASE